MSESSQDEVVPKSGYIERIPAGKKKGKFLWCALSGSSLYSYTDPGQVSPKAVYELAEAEVTVPADKRFTIDLKKDGKHLFSLAATSKEECDNWKTYLLEAVTKPPGEAPQKEKQKKKKSSMALRASKTVGGKVVTSGIGKSAVRGVVNEETKLLLVALKRIVSKVENNKVAEEIEDNMMKIITKAFFLEKDKKITIADFLVADAPLREAFELLIKMRDFSHRMKPSTVQENLLRVHNYLVQVEKILAEMLMPHLKPKSIKRLGRTFGLLGSEEFLQKAWSDEALEEERDLLTDAMSRYTQFHFN